MTAGSNHFSFATSYTVKPNDTLSAIVQHFYGHAQEWPAIYNCPLNRQTIGENPNVIHPGQHLFIPGRYVVQPNDTFSTITRQYFGDSYDGVEAFFMDANYQSSIDENSELKPGQVLYIWVPGRYVVQPADTLFSIGKLVYGEDDGWETIYGDNKSVIGENPNLIKPGQVLYLEPGGGVSGHGP